MHSFWQVEILGNDSRIHAEMDFGANITSIVLNNLTLGRSYFIRVCAFTSFGSGPYSPPLNIIMDPNYVSKINSALDTGIHGSIFKQIHHLKSLKKFGSLFLWDFTIHFLTFTLCYFIQSSKVSWKERSYFQ